MELYAGKENYVTERFEYNLPAGNNNRYNILSGSISSKHIPKYRWEDNILSKAFDVNDINILLYFDLYRAYICYSGLERKPQMVFYFFFHLKLFFAKGFSLKRKNTLFRRSNNYQYRIVFETIFI